MRNFHFTASWLCLFIACSEPQRSAAPATPLAWPLASLSTSSGLLPIQAPPPSEITRLKLAATYAKYLAIDGFPIIASSAVSDDALREARYLIGREVAHRPALLQPLVTAGVRFVVMAPHEMTTDVPEHADLTPKAYWDRRARGLGATTDRPAVSCGEENLLDVAGDPYAIENILLHEFAHVLHEFSLAALDPTFDRRLRAAYANAKAKGLWNRAVDAPGEPQVYAMENPSEYWAEATQSWFDSNRVNDNQHGPVDTREKVKAADPMVAALLTEVFGDEPWRYRKPRLRSSDELTHLANHGRPVGVAAFVWPMMEQTSGPVAPAVATVATLTLAAGPLPPVPSRSPSSSQSVDLQIRNTRSKPVQLLWLDFSGNYTDYGTIAPGALQAQQTYTGHVWFVTEGGNIINAFIAPAQSTTIVIK